MERGSLGKLFIVPQTADDREFLLSVDRKTRVETEQRFGLIVDYDWHCNTIANCLLETMIQNLAFMLKSNPSSGVGINFYDLFISQVSIKKNTKAEKEGNINIFFEPGSVAMDLVENGPGKEPTDSISPALMFTVEDPDDEENYKNLDYHTRYALTASHGITFTDRTPKYAVFAIGYTFIKNIFVELLYRLSNMKDEEGEEKLVSVNFNDNIEFHGLLKNGTVLLTMRPGMNAKLLIKCDELTEKTMGDDD
jgi:hypothetical protein